MANALQSGLQNGGLRRGGLHAGLGNGSIFNIASLDLNFAKYKNIGSFVTFTRASSGTFVGSDGVLQTAATDVPRFDHDPTTGESLGLLVEEARTNSIRNNTMVGAVAGTPGTLPTNWSVFTTLTGLTRQIVGIGTEDGITYIDVRLSGTPNIAGNYFLQTETNTSVSASNGQTWTSSAWVRLAAGSLSGVSAVRLSTSNRDSLGNVIAAGDTTFTPTSASLTTQRFVNTYTNASALTAFELLNFTFVLSGAAVDFTLRIGLPQLEQGAFATSPILTSTAAATRSADVASITGTAFSSWYRQDKGTFFVDAAEPPAYVAFQAYLTLQGASNIDEIRMWRSGGATTINCSHNLNNVVQGTINVTSSLIANRFAHSYSVAQGIASSANGGNTNQTTLTSTIPVTVLRIGARQNSTFYGNRTYKRLIYWPQRLPNSTLQSITQ